MVWPWGSKGQRPLAVGQNRGSLFKNGGFQPFWVCTCVFMHKNLQNPSNMRVLCTNFPWHSWGVA